MASINYRFSRTGSVTSAVSINFSISGNAIYGSSAGQDYTLSFPSGVTGTLSISSGSTNGTGTITIDAGQTFSELTLTTTVDAVNESTEFVNITITGSSPSVAINPSSSAAQVTILDDDFTVNGLAAPFNFIINNGAYVNNVNSPAIFNNAGNPPANFTSWVTASAINFYDSFFYSASSTDIFGQMAMIKVVYKIPSTQPTLPGWFNIGGVQHYLLVHRDNVANSVRFSYSYVTPTTVRFHIILYTGGNTVVATTSNTYPAGSWVDLVFTRIGLLYSLITASETLNYTAPSGTNNWSSLYFAAPDGSGVAAYKHTIGLNFNASMIPITPANL